MQIAAARACARAQAASGLPSTSRYLSNVPVALLPLLAETPSPSSPSSLSPGSFGVLASPLLSEACLCKIFSADTGVRTSPTSNYVCPVHSSAPSSSRAQFSSSSHLSPVKAVTQTPSPPDTPPRPLITPMPPPRPTRMFAFLPLLDTPTTTPEVTPSASAVTTPVLSPSASSSAIYSSSANSSQYSNNGAGPSSSAAYGAYGAYITDNERQSGLGYAGVGGSATLGLERKMGFGFVESSESEASGSESEKDVQDEDDDWPKDWPGKRVHVLHRTSPTNSHGHMGGNGNENSGRDTDGSVMPPSPPVEASTSRYASMQNHNSYFPPIPPSSPSQSPRPTSPPSRHSRSPNRTNRPTSLSTSPLNPRLSSYPPSPPSPSLSSSPFNPSSSSPSSSPRSTPGSPRSRQVPSRTQSPVFSHVSSVGQRRTSPSTSPVASERKMSLVMLA